MTDYISEYQVSQRTAASRMTGVEEFSGTAALCRGVEGARDYAVWNCIEDGSPSWRTMNEVTKDDVQQEVEFYERSIRDHMLKQYGVANGLGWMHIFPEDYAFFPFWQIPDQEPAFAVLDLLKLEQKTTGKVLFVEYQILSATWHFARYSYRGIFTMAR